MLDVVRVCFRDFVPVGGVVPSSLHIFVSGAVPSFLHVFRTCLWWVVVVCCVGSVVVDDGGIVVSLLQ